MPIGLAPKGSTLRMLGRSTPTAPTAPRHPRMIGESRLRPRNGVGRPLRRASRLLRVRWTPAPEGVAPFALVPVLGGELVQLPDGLADPDQRRDGEEHGAGDHEDQ